MLALMVSTLKAYATLTATDKGIPHVAITTTAMVNKEYAKMMVVGVEHTQPALVSCVIFWMA